MSAQQHRPTVLVEHVTETYVRDFTATGTMTPRRRTGDVTGRYTIQCLCPSEVTADTIEGAYAAFNEHREYEARKAAAEVAS